MALKYLRGVLRSVGLGVNSQPHSILSDSKLPLSHDQSTVSHYNSYGFCQSFYAALTDRGMYISDNVPKETCAL